MPALSAHFLDVSCGHLQRAARSSSRLIPGRQKALERSGDKAAYRWARGRTISSGLIADRLNRRDESPAFAPTRGIATGLSLSGKENRYSHPPKNEEQTRERRFSSARTSSAPPANQSRPLGEHFLFPCSGDGIGPDHWRGPGCVLKVLDWGWSGLKGT